MLKTTLATTVLLFGRISLPLTTRYTLAINSLKVSRSNWQDPNKFHQKRYYRAKLYYIPGKRHWKPILESHFDWLQVRRLKNICTRRERKKSLFLYCGLHFAMVCGEPVGSELKSLIRDNIVKVCRAFTCPRQKKKKTFLGRGEEMKKWWPGRYLALKRWQTFKKFFFLTFDGMWPHFIKRVS